MIEKRFIVYSEWRNLIADIKDTTGEIETLGEFVDLLNELHEENQRLKQYTKQVLQNHIEGWRGVYNPIDESIIVEICVVKSIAEDLGVDLE